MNDFITGAETERLHKGEFPWDAAHIRRSNKRPMRLDMPEDLKLRLDFIAENSPHSRVGFILHHIEPIIIEQSDLLIAKGHKPKKNKD